MAGGGTSMGSVGVHQDGTRWWAAAVMNTSERNGERVVRARGVGMEMGTEIPPPPPPPHQGELFTTTIITITERAVMVAEMVAEMVAVVARVARGSITTTTTIMGVATGVATGTVQILVRRCRGVARYHECVNCRSTCFLQTKANEGWHVVFQCVVRAACWCWCVCVCVCGCTRDTIRVNGTNRSSIPS